MNTNNNSNNDFDNFNYNDTKPINNPFAPKRKSSDNTTKYAIGGAAVLAGGAVTLGVLNAMGYKFGGDHIVNNSDDGENPIHGSKGHDNSSDHHSKSTSHHDNNSNSTSRATSQDAKLNTQTTGKVEQNNVVRVNDPNHITIDGVEYKVIETNKYIDLAGNEINEAVLQDEHGVTYYLLDGRDTMGNDHPDGRPDYLVREDGSYREILHHENVLMPAGRYEAVWVYDDLDDYDVNPIVLDIDGENDEMKVLEDNDDLSEDDENALIDGENGNVLEIIDNPEAEGEDSSYKAQLVGLGSEPETIVEPIAESEIDNPEVETIVEPVGIAPEEPVMANVMEPTYEPVASEPVVSDPLAETETTLDPIADLDQTSHADPAGADSFDTPDLADSYDHFSI